MELDDYKPWRTEVVCICVQPCRYGGLLTDLKQACFPLCLSARCGHVASGHNRQVSVCLQVAHGGHMLVIN